MLVSVSGHKWFIFHQECLTLLNALLIFKQRMKSTEHFKKRSRIDGRLSRSMFFVRGLCISVIFWISKWRYLQFLKDFVAFPYFVTHEAEESQDLKSERDLEITSSVLPF